MDGTRWMIEPVHIPTHSTHTHTAGEAPCIATIAVTSYWHLFVLRVLTGISLGGSLPLAFSMVGDLYGSKQRAAVLALVQISTGAGIDMGQAIAGFVGMCVDDGEMR